MRKVRYTLPLIPLRGISVFPGMILHFDVGRPQSITAVKQAMKADKTVFLCYQNDISINDPDRSDLADTGTIAEIHQTLNLPDGNVRILVEGLHRGRITRYTEAENYTLVNAVRLSDTEPENGMETAALMRRAMHLVEDFMEIYERIPTDVITSLLSIDNPGELADVIASNFPLKPDDKQLVLDELNVSRRLELLNSCLSAELEVLAIEKDITEKAQENMNRGNHEYLLREKLKAIHEELGDDNDIEIDIKKYKKNLEGRKLPEAVSEKLGEELERLRRTNINSQEYGVIQNYIETVIALPWEIRTTDNTDIARAAKILERDHFGLTKVKDRILEYIAVRSLGGAPKSNIICLVGPPGTGKTSIVKALAEALNRKYVRVSLGGIKNEAEIRGHRKTYVGAMPGRIIDAVKNAGSSNPLILFDEIDKMSSDAFGDPASAMLEVLDPEQNRNFRDHFLELPFDLSDTIFVTTANSLETVPAPLLDRMDVIEVEGYTPDEKAVIAKKYLMPKQRHQHGLTASQLKFTASSYSAIIDGYTRESGVRELEHQIAAVCRKTARRIAAGEADSVSVTAASLKSILGTPRYHRDRLSAEDKIGAVVGLAWTSAGGDTLDIEVNVMPGNGKLELTGNLGDVMKESARAALSYVRANAYKLGIMDDFYKSEDIHIHVPDGAVPKDGPSAGITMTTALVSALLGIPVRHDIAMTGEVTLRGTVLPIGGLKEKTLAALRFGVKKVIIPYENKCDYDELPAVVKDNMEFVFAKDMNTVLHHSLLGGAHKKTAVNARYVNIPEHCGTAVTASEVN